MHILFLIFSVGLNVNVAIAGFHSIDGQFSALDNKKSQVTYNDPYRWLESPFGDASTWVSDQGNEAQKEIEKYQSRNYWLQAFKFLYSKSKILGERKLHGNFVLRVVDQGLGEPNEVVLFDGDTQKRVIFSSKDLDSDQGETFVKIYLGPNKQYIVVPTYAGGSTDHARFYVIEIGSGKVLKRIEYAAAYGLTWTSPTTFLFHRVEGDGGLLLEYDIVNDTEIFRPELEKLRIDNSPRGDLVVKTSYKTEKMWIRSVENSEWVELPELYNRLVGQTKNALIFKKKNKASFDILVRLPYFKNEVGTPVLGKAKSYKANTKRVLSWVKTKGGYTLAKYYRGSQNWLLLLSPEGDIVYDEEWPADIEVRKFERVNDTQLKFLIMSPIVENFAAEFDITNKSFKDSHLKGMLYVDEKGQKYVSKFVTVKSADGSDVPVRIVHKEGLLLDGDNPMLVEGYGGFSNTADFIPRYAESIKLFLVHGGIYVAPALRGGQEFGEDWHEQARGENKQNTFNDMIATLEQLQQLGYSKPDRTAIMGWSNGGLLIGAVLTQRPDLVGLAIPGNGVQDMLRKDLLDYRFDRGWSYEYGDTNEPNSFNNLKKYSPVVRAQITQHYPPTLVVTGRNDSRVNPIHSYKLVAALQDAQLGKAPIMLLNVEGGGHWATYESMQGMIAYNTNVAIWSSIYEHLNITPPSFPVEFLMGRSGVHKINEFVDDELDYLERRTPPIR